MLGLPRLSNAVLLRFTPVCAAVILGALTLIAVESPRGLEWSGLRIAALEVGLLSTGFAIVLGLLRSRVPDDAQIGKRSAMAGLLATVALGVLSFFSEGASLPSISVLSLSTGIVAGFATFLPSVFRRHRPASLAPEVQVELERLEAELAMLDAGIAAEPNSHLVRQRQASASPAPSPRGLNR